VTAGCPDCTQVLDHCHGTLVRHADGSVECSDPTCVVPAVDAHGLVLTCADAGRCACADAVAAG
jgi:hypothetical protein